MGRPRDDWSDVRKALEAQIAELWGEAELSSEQRRRLISLLLSPEHRRRLEGLLAQLRLVNEEIDRSIEKGRAR